MTEGKVVGKGLLYVKDLDATYSIKELAGYTHELFKGFLLWCDVEELVSLQELVKDRKGCDKGELISKYLTFGVFL
ncbi:MAG: hypothetical protein GY928_23875 [Colwellia sp.]|nr:hypothetical protein [Colwellia sp.]